MYLLNTRETVLDNLERITGSRINTAYMIPGGVRFDLLSEDAAALLADLDTVEAEMRRYTRIFETGPMIALRSKGIVVMQSGPTPSAPRPGRAGSKTAISASATRPTGSSVLPRSPGRRATTSPGSCSGSRRSSRAST
jgi:energy-converting hydrogenase A subunit O